MPNLLRAASLLAVALRATALLPRRFDSLGNLGAASHAYGDSSGALRFADLGGFGAAHAYAASADALRSQLAQRTEERAMALQKVRDLVAEASAPVQVEHPIFGGRAESTWSIPEKLPEDSSFARAPAGTTAEPPRLHLHQESGHSVDALDNALTQLEALNDNRFSESISELSGTDGGADGEEGTDDAPTKLGALDDASGALDDASGALAVKNPLVELPHDEIEAKIQNFAQIIGEEPPSSAGQDLADIIEDPPVDDESPSLVGSMELPARAAQFHATNPADEHLAHIEASLAELEKKAGLPH